jgi:putative CocE/NonD family hydrolase
MMNNTTEQGFPNMQIIRNQMVCMRDGVKLATDIYLPRQLRGSLPVVIERTPYDKSKPSRSEKRLDGHHRSREEMAAELTDHGFIAVFQDCRGRYASEGHFIKYVNEGEDGYDTLSWIVEQSWCNGRVGSMGLSYAAHTQLAMACLNPPGLTAMVLDSGGFANAYQCGIRQGGAFELKQATWAFKQAKESPAAKADPSLLNALEQEDIRFWFTQMPWRAGHSPLRHTPEYENYLFKQWSHGTFDEYWQQLGIYAQGFYQQIPDIPVLFMSSWYDAYVSSTLSNYRAFTEGRSAPQRLVMGPWLHGDRNITHSGNAEFGAAAAFDGQVDQDWLQCRVQWFERHLKATQPVAEEPHRVQVFLMGGGSGRKDDNQRIEHGGRWLETTQWPLPGSEEVSFYLTEEGGLELTAPHSSDAHRQYCSDPNNPVPTIGGSLTSGAPVFVGGAFDQRESPEFFGALGNGRALSERADVLSFQTEPLQHDLIVAGPILVELWVESDCPDTDFTAKLVDVYPPSDDYRRGYAMNITDGIRRCRYRDSWENPAPLVPGERFKITIEPFATCNVFKQGHRLRLDIASSNFPHFDVNPNSGEPEGQARCKRVAANTVHLSVSAPSKVVLRILPVDGRPVAPKC